MVLNKRINSSSGELVSPWIESGTAQTRGRVGRHGGQAGDYHRGLKVIHGLMNSLKKYHCFETRCCAGYEDSMPSREHQSVYDPGRRV